MNKSNIIEKLKETTLIKLYDEEVKRTGLGDPDEVLVQRAFKKICEAWNKSDSSRKFLKHVIGAFYPTHKLEKVGVFSDEQIKNGRNCCCILGIKVAGTDKIAEEWNRIGLENLFVRITDKKIYRERGKLPVEIRNATYAYSSKKSDKFLSGEAAYALDLFVQRSLEYGEEEIVDLLTPKEKKKRKEEPRMKNSSSGSPLGSLMDEETIRKLKNIKKGK